jgi:outer membrane protein, heavy metal efflux system
VQRAAANVQVAQAQLEQIKLTVQADVTAATEAYTREREIVDKTLPDMRDHAGKNLAIMSDAYRTGGVDLLRYIDAERTEIDVESNALRTLSEFHQSALRLELAYGVQP